MPSAAVEPGELINVMKSMRPYIFDNASSAEYQRLDLMSKILDPQTRASLSVLSLREGWNCLELGGGNGSMTEWLCAAAGACGSVTSIDLNPGLIKLIPAQNLTVRQADVSTADLPAEAFDRVMCRALLHQVAEHARIRAKRVRKDHLAKLSGCECSP